MAKTNTRKPTTSKRANDRKVGSRTARSLYFKDLSKVKILSAEEQARIYAEYAESGFTDNALRDQLVEGCLRLVVTRAKKFSRNNDALLNGLICAGNEGLLTALKKYDPTKGTRFSSYAIWWVDLAIRNALSELHPVKVPMWRQKKGTKLRRLRNEGHTTEEMAEECGLSVDKVKELERHQAHSADLTALNAVNAVDYVRSVSDISAFKEVDIEQESIEDSARSILHEVISELSEDEQNIIRSYYGIGRKAMNLPQIAATRDVTSERVRQIKNKVLDRLKSALKKRDITSIEDIL